MTVWDSVNDTLAIVVWPAAVVVTLWIFRPQVRGLINRIREGAAFGASFKAEAVEQRVSSKLNAELRRTMNPREFARQASDAINGLIDAVDARAASDSNGQAQIGDESDEDEPQSSDAFTRVQVEEFIRAASNAGYDMGAAQVFQGDPEPVIKWTDDNVPEINGWRREAGHAYIPLTESPGELVDGRIPEQVERLEAEIKNLTIERYSRSFMSVGSWNGSGTERALDELKDKLREIDPLSPWA